MTTSSSHPGESIDSEGDPDQGFIALGSALGRGARVAGEDRRLVDGQPAVTARERRGERKTDVAARRPEELIVGAIGEQQLDRTLVKLLVATGGGLVSGLGRQDVASRVAGALEDHRIGASAGRLGRRVKPQAVELGLERPLGQMVGLEVRDPRPQVIVKPAPGCFIVLARLRALSRIELIDQFRVVDLGIVIALTACQLAGKGHEHGKRLLLLECARGQRSTHRLDFGAGVRSPATAAAEQAALACSGAACSAPSHLRTTIRRPAGADRDLSQRNGARAQHKTHPGAAPRAYNRVVAAQLHEVSLKAVIVRDGRILLLARHSHRGDLFWDLPGGRLQKGESLERGLERELFDEIGYRGSVSLDEIVTLGLWDDPDYDGPPKLLAYYRMEIDCTPLTLSEEHAGAAWASPDQLAAVSGDCLDEARLEPEIRAVCLEALSAA